MKQLIKRVIYLYLNQCNSTDEHRLSEDIIFDDIDFDDVFRRLRDLTRLGTACSNVFECNGTVKDAVSLVLHQERFSNDLVYSCVQKILMEVLIEYPDATADVIWCQTKAALDEVQNEVRSELPDVLDTELAKRYWQELEEENIVDANQHPLVSNRLASVLAYDMGRKLNINPHYRWIYFQKRWHISGLGKIYDKTKDSIAAQIFSKKIRNILY